MTDLQPYSSTDVPPLLRWDIVSKCNLSCSHCCVGDMLRDDETEDLSTEELTRSLQNAANAGVRQVHFLGGEPTIRKDFLEICKAAKEAGLEFSYNTNGIRQDENYLTNIADLDPSGITISVDGPDALSHDQVRGEGTFEKTVSYVRKLVALREERNSKRPSIQIQSVLTASWADRAEAMVELAVDLKADSLVVNHLASMGDAIANSDDLTVDQITTFRASQRVLKTLERYPQLNVSVPIRLKQIQYFREKTGLANIPLEPNACPSMDKNSQVNYDGTIHPCQLAQSHGLGEETTLPSVLDSNWDGMFQTEVYEEFQTQVKGDLASVYEHQVPCNRCPFLGNGCKPCPLPSDTAQYTTNYQCLIAEGLLQAGQFVGGVANLTEEEELHVMEDVIRTNPPRYRPEAKPAKRALPIIG